MEAQPTTELSPKASWIETLRERTVDPACDHAIYRRFLDFARAHREDEHYLRNCQTLSALLAAGFPFESEPRILECGGLSLIGHFFEDEGHDVRSTSTDLRYEIDAEDASVDLLLSLEVLEHIKDQREERFEDLVLFNESGVRQFCSEMTRVLRPGGTLLLTTPNPCSLRALRRLVEYRAPQVFRPHVREYALDEIESFLPELRLESYRTFFSFFDIGPARNAAADELFAAVGADAKDRGDDHVCVFRR